MLSIIDFTYYYNNTMKNQVLRINGQPSLIYQSSRKLMWLSLPDLSPISKYYTKSNFVNTMGPGSLLVIDKNCVNFITVTLPPLGLNLFKQQFLDWQPTGGLCLSLILILYHKHTINFYQRSQNLKKTWTIEVMQEITEIKSSPEQKVIGMTVKQKRNTVFLWNLHDISNKPFQQVTVSQEIIKWSFYDNDMLTILTSKEIQVYYPKDGQYSLQFFVEMAHLAIDYCFFDRPKVNQHSGRRAVYPLAILSPGGKIFIYQLYDIDKRMKNSLANIIATIQAPQNTSSIICGYENDNSQVIIAAETSRGKPFSLTLTPQFITKKHQEHLPQLLTTNPQQIQYCKQTICTEDPPKQQYSPKDNKIYKLYRIKNREQYQFIGEYQCNGFAILGGYHLFCFGNRELVVYEKRVGFQRDRAIVVGDVKVGGNLVLMEERDGIVYFVSGIKIYRLDLVNKQFKAHGFVAKNDRLKFVEIRNQTRSLLYRSNDEYVLFEYQTPQHPQKQSQKVAIKTIKSSPNNMISLRNNRWIQKLPQKLIIGQSIKVLVEFDLAKFFKQLTQQNILLDYQVYWTTHDGILLLIKNYLFVLELTQSSDGYSINPIKRSLNYLHCRFDPDAGPAQVMDARNMVVREGYRIVRLGSKMGSFVSEDPYSLPDTLLKRQLLMRKMYPPHHPKIVQYLIQLGYFNLLDRLFRIFWDELKQNTGLSGLYKKIGADFFINFEGKADKIVPKNALEQDEQTLKKLCDLILESPHLVHLQQNGSLILQSQIQALIFKQQNSRALDFYSEVVITQFKTFETKNESFRTMHIAYMLHSINKEEAVTMLRQDKAEIDWDWMKKYSIVMWYDVKTQIKTWAEEIGTNLFKLNKQPLDCLFWYTIAGKKNVLIQLFKKYLYNTAQHQKIFTFLQRDFTQAKNKKAAVNNAYALVDKKRYLHALAFFIYGQKIDEAISICLSKLKDINLAFLMCNLMDDAANKNNLIEILLKEGDVWARHIGYFYRNQHIDSFNCLFQEEDVNVVAHWNFQPKLTNFHPCLHQFAQSIEKSIPVKRELQQQQMNKTKSDPNDIFQSFFGSDSQPQQPQPQQQQKHLSPNYKWIQQQSTSYFIRNSCPTLALMIEPTNHRAKRAYDLCQFLLTKEVNNTVMELIEEMEDYASIVDAKIKEGVAVKGVVEEFWGKFRDVVKRFTLSSIVINDKSKIGELMHYANLAQLLVDKLRTNHIQQASSLIKNLQIYIQISKILLILQLQTYQSFQTSSKQFISTILQPQKSIPQLPSSSSQFWLQMKSKYDRLAQPKKNKKQNLYDAFEQSLYKYAFKKGELTSESSQFKLGVDVCVAFFVKKAVLDIVGNLVHDKTGNMDIVNLVMGLGKKLGAVLGRWADDKVQEELQKQYNMMMNDGVVSKLKLTFLPSYLNDNFQPLCRGLLLLRQKPKKPLIGQMDRSKPQVDPITKTDIIQIYRSKQQLPKCLTINKNEGQGMQLALLTKRGVRKVEVLDSLVNRNRTQDGVSLLHQDLGSNMEGGLDFGRVCQGRYGALVEKFVCGVMDNRREYDGNGIIKGSTKRTSPQYLKPLQPPPYLQPTQLNCIECHHFLPIYMLGNRSSIQLCTFSNNTNYNRIKCPTMGDIVKIRSYQQRVTVLDGNGNLGAFGLDARLGGNCVYALKKANVIDFCLMTPTTYGICTSNSIQVIDSLLHPKRQTVFKTSTNQSPIGLDYYNSTKLSTCRKSDLLIHDIRMDILQQSRDLQGKAKCISSNYKNKLLIGKQDNKVRVMDMGRSGGENDYDVKLVGNYRVGVGVEMERVGVEDIEVMGRFVVALNSQGAVNMFAIQ